jgi:hypothetical protein
LKKKVYAEPLAGDIFDLFKIHSYFSFWFFSLPKITSTNEHLWIITVKVLVFYQVAEDMEKPLNVAQKLVRSHLIKGEMTPGTEIGIALTQDATGTLVMLESESIITLK